MKVERFVRRLLLPVLSGMAMLFMGCSSIDYKPGELEAFRKRPNAVELEFFTKKGRQVVYYVAPDEGVKTAPKPLIISFPGIGSRALDRLDWADKKPAEAGMLLIDYPNRGQCEGLLQPSRLPDTYAGALQTLAKKTGLPQQELQSDLRIVGHSFGTAAALVFAQHYPVKKAVLLAPMTSTRKAFFLKMGPIAWLIPDNLDNEKAIQNLINRKQLPQMSFIHGTKDTTIPVRMSRTLQKLAPGKITLHEIKDGTHTSVLQQRDLVFQELLERVEGEKARKRRSSKVEN